MTSRYSTEILKKIRDVMKDSRYVNEALQAYIVPYIDAHHNEYFASCDQRVKFISGFSGTKATAVITESQAALWTDGRYFLQAGRQLDENWILMKETTPGTPSVGDWLNKVLPRGSKIGFDPFLLDHDLFRNLKRTFIPFDNFLVPTQKNLIDAVWEDKPAIPSNSVDHLPIKYTGKTIEKKMSEVRSEMEREKATLLILTALDEIAWLFNLRGSDIAFNPVFFSYSIVTPDSVYLFINSDKLMETAKNSLLECQNLQILPYESFIDTLKELLNKEQRRVWLNSKASQAIASLISKKNLYRKVTPVCKLKGRKNEVEMNGARNAHIKDGAALCEFFLWLTNNISSGNITEVSAASKLEDIKKSLVDYVGLSFATISASGPNASVVHYQPSKETDRKLSTSEVYLCDCGTQYLDGTTDVTRTWHFGEPSAMEKKSYTLVLKGHIAVSSAVFPNGCTGHRLDSFARKFLWEVGLDYLHGTGHGVGAFLNVHEGPCGIGANFTYDDPGIQTGTILSIEPGYYEDNNFGIRLENLALVIEAQTEHKFQNLPYLTFEPLTLFPFQKKLIDRSLLTLQEISWINKYHLTCLEKVGKLLHQLGKTEALEWLAEATTPLE